MTPRAFVKKYYPYAKASQAKTGLPADAILAQSALETGWGNTIVGNMMFGVKDTDGLNGNEQLVSTTEYHDNPDKKYPVVIKITQVGKKLWKYWVKDWFRKYSTPEESFIDHANFIKKNKRYHRAIVFRHEPSQFLSEVARVGYATSPQYETQLLAILKMVEKIIKEEAL